MFIGYLRMSIFIPSCRSLKEKRQVVVSVKERVRRKFNISVAEKPSNKWQICELSFAHINYTRQTTNDMMDRVEEFVRLLNNVHILDVQKEIF
jgi:uncharacterized protein YlxP (DUF503 family)